MLFKFLNNINNVQRNTSIKNVNIKFSQYYTYDTDSNQQQNVNITISWHANSFKLCILCYKVPRKSKLPISLKRTVKQCVKYFLLLHVCTRHMQNKVVLLFHFLWTIRTLKLSLFPTLKLHMSFEAKLSTICFTTHHTLVFLSLATTIG